MTTPTTADELLQAYPEAAAQLVQRGASAERARVLQHLRLGAQGVDFRFSHSQIESGAELTPELAESYLQQRMQRLGIDARQSECDAAGSVIDGGHTQTTPTYGRDRVADEVERLMDGTTSPHHERLIR